MDLGIRRKSALVTGAGRGLGSAIATAFAEGGCPVGLISRSPESLSEVFQNILPGAFGHEDSYWHKVQHQEERKMQEFLHFHQAIGRMGELSEIVPFVLFMASVHASFAPGAIFEAEAGAGGVL
jgi:NAD(P)-dependent dehydrogenase (short-subunit alcohol dehydrogenase family)